VFVCYSFDRVLDEVYLWWPIDKIIQHKRTFNIDNVAEEFLSAANQATR
jgi:hypothetical protein